MRCAASVTTVYPFHVVHIKIMMKRSRSSYSCEDYHECYIPPLTFTASSHHCTLSFSKPDQRRPFDLSSLAGPFGLDYVALLMLATTSIFLSVILVRLSGTWNVTEISFSVLAGLIGQSVNGSRGIRYELCYWLWLICVGFLSMGYTNVLQSILVVPRIQPRRISFEEMLRQNFTFEAQDFTHVKFIAMRVRRDEKLLQERVVEYKLSKLESSYSVIEHFSEGTRKVLVVNSNTIDGLKWVPTMFKVDLVVGKERFFNLFYWWDLSQVERALLLAKSLENLKEVGFVSYFFSAV